MKYSCVFFILWMLGGARIGKRRALRRSYGGNCYRARRQGFTEKEMEAEQEWTKTKR